MKYKAFTLAEILIVIGIVGVISAMTIPSLITECRAIILRVQFQIAWAKVNQVYLKMVAEDANLTADVAQKDPYYQQYPSLIAKHMVGAHASSETKSRNGNIQEYFKKLGYTDMSGNVGSHILWFIDDGYVELPNGEIWWIENGNGQQALTIDINGVQHGPNKWGYDLFTFIYNVEKGQYVPDTEGACDNIRYLSSGNYNGRSCASKAAKDPKYFKKLLRHQKVYD